VSSQYDMRLLEPGWAGLLTLEEAKYIQQELWNSRELRRKWHVRGKRLSLLKVARLAFPEDEEAAVANIKAEQSKAFRRRRRAENINSGNSPENLDGATNGLGQARGGSRRPTSTETFKISA